MTNDPGNPGNPGNPGEYQQGWPGGQQQSPYPAAYGQPQQQPAWGGYPQQGQPGQYGEQPTAFGGPQAPIGGPQGRPGGSAFSALFDFDFSSFATPAVVKILYVVGMVLIGLVYIGALIGGFTQGVGVGLVTLVVGGVAALFYLIFFRVMLEFFYAVVRMSEDIHHRKG